MLSLDSSYKTVYIYTGARLKERSVNSRLLVKRIFDIVFAGTITLLVLSWMIPIIGILIRIGSAGPILYIQKRTGYRGKPFNCLKFRTMTHNPKATFQQATKNDSRITPIGKFLRKTNLDEMPQFLNVLAGDMSIVGPRPHPIPLDAQFWNVLPKYSSRYRSKPGITGLAQVRGCRGETDVPIKMQHRIKYDRFYNKKSTLYFDVWICWQTFIKTLHGDKNAW